MSVRTRIGATRSTGLVVFAGAPLVVAAVGGISRRCALT
jgi:hypothetical protein